LSQTDQCFKKSQKCSFFFLNCYGQFKSRYLSENFQFLNAEIKDCACIWPGDPGIPSELRGRDKGEQEGEKDERGGVDPTVVVPLHLSLLYSWNHRRAPPHQLLVEMRSYELFAQAGLEL
jgi:hypothetical protein